MAKLFFLLFPVLISFLPVAFADSEFLFENDSRLYYKLSSNPERFIDDPFFLSVVTDHGIVKLDKSSCSFAFYANNTASGFLFSDSIVPKMANNGTETWQQITQINNASCEAYGSIDQLVAKKHVPNVGLVEYKYINYGNEWKTQLEATNLSALTNKKFGFTQTIDLNKDVIKFGNTNRNLDNFSGQTFARAWLETNQAKLFDFLNDYLFDVGLGFDMLESVYVEDIGTNKSKLSFNYFHNASVLLPNQILIIDPTITQSSGGSTANIIDSTQHSVGEKLETASAELIGATLDSFDVWLKIGSGSPSGDITARIYNGAGTLQETSTNTINANTLTGSFAQKSFTFAGTHTLAENDRIVVYFASGDGSNFVGVEYAGSDVYDSTNTIFTRFVSSAWDDSLTGRDVKFVIVYSIVTPPDSITDLAVASVGQTTASLSFTPPNLNGESLINYMLNVTTPQQSAPITTFKMNATSSPFSVTGLTLGTSYSAQASAYTAGGGNWTLANVLNFTTASFNPPGTPTLGATALSDTSIRFTSVRGTAGDNSTIWYSFRCELNGAGSWTDIVTNSSLPTPSIYEYSGLTLGDELICQWRDGSVDGWSPYSNNATDTLELLVLSDQRTDDTNDHLLRFINFIAGQGGVYFGLGVIPFAVMMIGFMAGKKTVRIFALITLSLMGMIHASGYYVYPDWYWTLALLFGIALILGRMKSD